MIEWWNEIRPMLTGIGAKLLYAIAVLIVGRLIIIGVVKLMGKGKLLARTSPEVKSYAISFAKIGLNAILLISVIGILGVPMTSVITVLASAGVAVGLALQGSLANLAGGIMLMIFKPFRVGDYVSASDVAGTVREITIFYTVFITVDNKRIMVPNGSLMNASVVNYSSEPTRRVDIPVSCARQEDPARIEDLLREVASESELVLKDPAAAIHTEPFTDNAMNFTLRCWCRNADYWTVYYDLTARITDALVKRGVSQPVVAVKEDKNAHH